MGSAKFGGYARRSAMLALAMAAACGQPERVSVIDGTVRQASVRAPTVRLAGPVPDFAPMAAIVTHRQLGDMAPALAPLLSRVLGSHHVVDDYSVASSDAGKGDGRDDSLAWVRDYHPLFVRGDDGQLVALNYLASNPSRRRYTSPHLRRGDGRAFPSATLPLVHENGNLVTTGARVFITETIFRDNAEQRPDLEERGYRVRTRDEVLQLLATALHREVDDIVVLPPIPHETTGHVDLFVLPLDDHSVMVPAIAHDAMQLVEDPWLQHVGQKVMAFLDEQAKRLATLGLSVSRLPMAPPSMQLPDDAEFELVVYSPANTLLADVAGARHAFIPSLSADGSAVHFARYAAEHARFFEARGWQPHLVDATELSTYLGLIRCVTATVPQ